MVEKSMKKEAKKEMDKQGEQNGIGSYRKIAMIVGILFITATVAYSIGMVLLDPILRSSDYLTDTSENENTVIIGAFFVLIDSVAVAGIGIMIFPILKK